MTQASSVKVSAFIDENARSDEEMVEEASQSKTFKKNLTRVGHSGQQVARTSPEKAYTVECSALRPSRNTASSASAGMASSSTSLPGSTSAAAQQSRSRPRELHGPEL